MIRPLKQTTYSDLKRAVIANAVGTGTYPIAIGDAIQPGATGHAKFVTCAASSNPILGIVTGLIYNGNKVSERSTVTGISGSTTNAGPGTDNETASNNWSVEYIPAYVPMEYEADISAVAGTTTDSSAIGGYFNVLTLSATQTNSIDTNGQLDEASIALFSGTAGQFVSFGYTSYNTKKVYCRVNKQV